MVHAATPITPKMLPDYTLGDVIYQGTRTAVYRAVENDTQQLVVIKMLSEEHPSFSELVQFRNQYMVAKNLPIAGIVQPLSLEPCGNGYALVMADFGGVDLGQYAQQHLLSLTETLDIALQLADILHELQQHRVIHKDIKPANILIHPETQQIKLIDFSIASLLPKETQALQSPKNLEGTLAYLAPEQTGRMNRAIDYRTDFYAFGVTLYQLFTGLLPFISDDPMELLHCHIAQTPIPVNQVNPQVPALVAAIVDKLMAKNAEDRYQSALGLKHDLEQCLTQWQAQGEIAQFSLGQQDLSDRFLIPEKLYGREPEVKTLLEAFDRTAQGASELMLVAGFSGIGKTAVIKEVHKPIVQRRGYFIKGKFDQFNRNIPGSAFVQAFQDLVGQLLSESDAALHTWRTQISEALGENAQVIIDLIPALEKILGPQPDAPLLTGNAAQNRFRLLFQKFIQVFTAAEHPLVIFVDDLQWADSASLNLIQVLTAESQIGHLLLLGAYRDNEVFSGHPLMLPLDDLQKAGSIIHTLTLKPLSTTSLNHLVADTLQTSTSVVNPLTDLIMQKTQGNPFFATQFLDALHQEQLITFDYTLGSWQCDIVRVQAAAVTDDVVEFMAVQLQKLPDSAQEILKLTACLGAQFDLDTLAIVSEKSHDEIVTALWPVLQAGLILPENDVYKFYLGENHLGDHADSITSAHNTPSTILKYQFLHDRVQQAAYSLISTKQKQTIHLTIGHRLWQNLTADALEDSLFAVVNHLNSGENLITDRSEREAIAQLNLRASQKAKTAIAYEASCRYCQQGQQFLDQASWTESYPIWLELALIEIEANFFMGDLETAEKLADAVLTQTQTLLDRIRVHELQILFEINKNQMTEAIALALDVLALFGAPFPQTTEAIQAEIASLRQEIALPKEAIADLIKLPNVRDAEKLAAIRILTNASSAAYIANPVVYPLIALQTVRYCLQYGNSDLAASAYSWYGALLCGVYNEIDSGYEFGKLSLKLLETFNANALIAKVSNMFNVFIRPWKEPLRNATKDLPTAIQGGFDNGDIEYALYAAVHHCNYLFYAGEQLDVVQQKQASYSLAIDQANYTFHADFLKINQQTVANLFSETTAPNLLQGDFFDQETYLQQWQESNIVFLLLCFYEAQTRLAYLFEDYPTAIAAGEKGGKYQQAASGTLYAAEHVFYYSLALLSQDTLTPSQLEQLNQNQQKIKAWAACASSNFQHQYDLLEAEHHRHAENQAEAIIFYDRAISGAQENGFIQIEALANELAAKFYLDWGKEKIAAAYMQDAYYCYFRWGADAKLTDLKQRYTRLLAPILQPQRALLSSEVDALLDSTTSLTAIGPASRHTSNSTSYHFAANLDLATVLKASQTLSSEIEMERLLTILLHTVMENAGATRGILLMPRTEEWFVEAIATLDAPAQIQPIALSKFPDLAPTLINTVKRNLEPIVIADATTYLPLAADDYVNRHQPKSLLCNPISQRGKLIAILYLENQVTVGAFNRDRVNIINLLASQVAISLDNARLYQKVEDYSYSLEAEVERKTQILKQRNQDLEQAFKDLKQTQAQLIQTEKMSSLGQMVAGIAHEFNNPVNFIKGNLQHLEGYLKDLQELMALYQTEYPDSNPVIQAKQEEIDLDFILEDTAAILHSMAMGSERIKQIVLSLRNFSRLDEASFKTVDIHSGIDSTLLIVQHRLNSRSQKLPKINVVREYGDLLPISCCPSQLNQVFLNIINNAIDAIQENPDCSASPEIRIRTEILNQKQIRITIANTDSTISPEDQQKVFEPFFTTKSVGDGTGMGLSVSYSIIQNHGGTMTVTSQPGAETAFEITLPHNK